MKFLLEKLEEYLGNDIIIGQKYKNDRIITYKGTGANILSTFWYEQRITDDAALERERIVSAAANIIFEDIRFQMNDLEHYPIPREFMKNATSVIPKTLAVFLDTVITQNKKRARNGL